MITMLACHPSMLTQRSMHHQKSSSDSPFQANTATPMETEINLLMLLLMCTSVPAPEIHMKNEGKEAILQREHLE